MQRNLTTEDISYIDNYEEFIERVKRWENPIFEDGMAKGKEIGVEIGIKKTRKKTISRKNSISKENDSRRNE